MIILRSLSLATVLAVLAFFQLGEPVLAGDTATHGAWSVECPPRAGNSEPPCVAKQSVATDPAGKNVVLGIIVEPGTGERRPRIAFRMTNKAYERAGVGVKVDSNPATRLRISGCDDKVCEARGWLTDELLAQLRNGRLLRFAFFVDAKNQITYPVSLNGFDDAFNALQDSDRR